MKQQCFNPYLPSWEYIPDGEPHVFGDRVYLYGSHDRFNGWVYCPNDYLCWSAPVNDLGAWRCEGVIYPKTADPLNPDGSLCLFAPDVTRGADGRYYLYYVLDKAKVVSVAVCDTPAGRYRFYGFVHYPDGARLGERAGDLPQFDPGVYTEGGKTYLFTGFCPDSEPARPGAMCTVLGADMLTVQTAPKTVAPGVFGSKGTGYEGHEYYEAPSLRKRGDLYYFIYSSCVYHELCYATSPSPAEPFKFGGVVVSNNDMHIDTYKPADKPMFYGGNNHGSIVEINGEWYIFYHRHTNGTNFSRQGCIEKIHFAADGSIPQVEMTSCGGNGAPLRGAGRYSAHIACNLFCSTEALYTDGTGAWMGPEFPKITQDDPDGAECPAHIANMKDGATAGFKYFDCHGVNGITLETRGYAHGVFEIKTAWDGVVLASAPVFSANVWTPTTAALALPDGVHALYFTYRGTGSASLAAFTLHT